mgnify:CR=1 FL=1
MSSGENLDDSVLAHIARYCLTFQEIVRHIYCPDSNPKKILYSLRERGLVEARAGFGGNRRAYFLTGKGANAAGVNAKRAVPAGSDAFPTHFALLGFCCLAGKARIRLHREEVEEALGGTPPGRYHCLESAEGRSRVFEAYVPGGNTRPQSIVERVRQSAADARARDFLGPWIEASLYAQAVLVDSAERLQALLQIFSRELPNEHVHVELVPAASQLERALHELA